MDATTFDLHPAARVLSFRQVSATYWRVEFTLGGIRYSRLCRHWGRA